MKIRVYEHRQLLGHGRLRGVCGRTRENVYDWNDIRESIRTRSKGGEENTTNNALGAIEDVLLENVSLGFNFAVAVAKSSGALFTWGAALDDQEADSKYGLKPRLVKHEPANINVAFTKVSSGYKHCAAITSDATLFTWGWSGSVGQHFEDEESSAGQLGLGNDFDYPTPTEVKWKDRSTKVLDVDAGKIIPSWLLRED